MSTFGFNSCGSSLPEASGAGSLCQGGRATEWEETLHNLQLSFIFTLPLSGAEIKRVAVIRQEKQKEKEDRG